MNNSSNSYAIYLWSALVYSFSYKSFHKYKISTQFIFKLQSLSFLYPASFIRCILVWVLAGNFKRNPSFILR